MSEPVFVLRAARLRAARGVTIAVDVALSASPGEVVAVEGPNGSGKTTLLAAAAGLLPLGGLLPPVALPRAGGSPSPDRSSSRGRSSSPGRAMIRPASVGYSPERALLPRMSVLRWLVGLARTAGLSRHDSYARADEVLERLGLASAASRPLHVLSRGNSQRALVAQALVGVPDLVILDEPSGGLDADGVARVAAEITRAADRRAVVLVARHPTAPLPLPPGTTWRFLEGTVRSTHRDGTAVASPPAGSVVSPPAGSTAIDSPATAAVPSLVELETGDGVVRRLSSDALPGELRAALDAGLAIRRVQPIDIPAQSRGAAPAAAVSPTAIVPDTATASPTPSVSPAATVSDAASVPGTAVVSPTPTVSPTPSALDATTVSRAVPAPSAIASAPVAFSPVTFSPVIVRRAGVLARIAHGARHRARLLAVSQWFAAPMLLFLALLSIVYATDAGPPLQAAAVTAIGLIPVMTWLTVLAHRVDGRELARAFAAHVGGRARAHLATDLCLVPYAVGLVIVAIAWPLASQGGHPHPLMLVLRIVELHLGAALFGIGLGSLLALIERIGWRLIVTVAVFLGLIIVRHTPLTPLLKLSTATVTAATPIASQVAWLCLPGVVLVAVASYLTTRLS